MTKHTDAGAVHLIRMASEFTFKGETYPPGSWLQLSPGRRAYTHRQYIDTFTERPEPEW